MPVSPQDFALWSQMTGNPYPQTPAERMTLAPHVYDYTRNIGRQGGPTMGPVRRAVDVVGKAALLAGGLAGAAYLANKFGGDDGGGGGGSGAVSVPAKHEVVEEAVERIAPTEIAEVEGPSVESVRFAREKARGLSRAELISQQEKRASLRRAASQLGPAVVGAEPPIPGAADPYALREVMSHLSKQGLVDIPRAPTFIPRAFTHLELDNEPAVGLTVLEAQPNANSQVSINSGDVTPPTTSQRFNQSLIADQTGIAQELKGTSAYKPTLGAIEQKPVTQSELIATGQHFSPGTELEQARNRAVEKIESSPIAAMSRPVAQPSGPSGAEIYELDTLLKRTHARHSQEERNNIRNQLLSQKYPSALTETPTEEPQKIVTVRPSYPVRVSEEVASPAAKVSANEFLSEMSQKLGPISTHEISRQRSPGVKGLSFYPGGEIGVQMRHGGGGEYAYATSDPYRLALSDYAEEGFPTGMGKIGAIVSKAGLGPQLGVQKALTHGGEVSAIQPEYSGLMGSREIAKKLTSKSQRIREQAESHAETKSIMQALEEQAAMRRAGVI